MSFEWMNTISLKELTHRNCKLLLCLFPDNPSLLKKFRKEFPSAKWSRTHSVFYFVSTNLAIPKRRSIRE